MAFETRFVIRHERTGQVLPAVKKQLIKQMQTFSLKSAWFGDVHFSLEGERNDKAVFNSGTFLGITQDTLRFDLSEEKKAVLVKVTFSTGRNWFSGKKRLEETLQDFIALLPSNIVDGLNE